jgi:signal transduction histidine kinase
MTIRRRLTLSFAVILALLAVNLAIYFWSNQRREATVEDLRRAISRQSLISSISQTFGNIQKQITLLNQLAGETAGSGTQPEEVAEFDAQLENVDGQLKQLVELSDPSSRENIESFAQRCRDLSSSWRIFYQNFGVDLTKAITEVAVHSEPLAQEVLQNRLPQLQKDEQARVELASANFYEVARLTDQTSILIFALSAAVAIGVAVGVSRQLTHGLNWLKEGAHAIGSGNLNQRIELKGNDELADLAHSFNDMTGKLSHAHDQLTLLHGAEKKRGEELAGALDQLRKAQDQLLVQQKLASLGSLTAGIAHEIKNPLNFVTNFAEISGSMVHELRQLLETQRERMKLEEFANVEEILRDLEQNVSKIQEHGKRADSIVRGMLMHSRGQAGQRQMTNINALLAEYVKLAYHGMRAQDTSFNVTIDEDYDPSIKQFSVIPQDLSRVFLNVANNACYAANEKRKRLGNGFAPTVWVKTTCLGERVEVRIRDNGDGIPAQLRQKIFEPFFTTKPAGSGTGLGLSMSYDIVVHQHKGEIRIESEPGEYAEFVITLPSG